MPEDNFQLNTPALPGTVMPFSAEAEQAGAGRGVAGARLSLDRGGNAAARGLFLSGQ